MVTSLNETECINYYNVVNMPILNSLNKPVDELKFCEESAYVAYSSFVLRHKQCQKECQRDCEEENYNVLRDIAYLGLDSGYSPFNTTILIIRPDRKMNEVVEHKSDLNAFQTIGYLGGHAHIWLGLSAIQLYDVFCSIIMKIKFLWEKFVQW